ncbi:MAG: hypothetical protein H6613_19415 [Ignavibacteriales bacterium]|nr:hypothetical protein [Ignavibacteriales bacterium]
MSKFPIIKIVLFFLLRGILLQELFNFPITILVTASILVFLFTLILLFIPNLVNQKFIQVSLIYLVSVLLGSISLYIQGFEKAEYPFDVPKINNVQILGKVKEIDLIKK